MTSARICVLCDPEDEDALWLSHALSQSGEDVECVLPGELVHGSILSYRIGADGATSMLRIRDGRNLDGTSLGVVINRIRELPAGPSDPTTGDELYLAEERRAVVVAWLRTLPCPVLNPPRASTLGGPAFSIPVWRAIARRHGLRIRPWHHLAEEAPPHHLLHGIVVGNRFIDASGDLPQAKADALVAMARHVGTPVLGVTLVHSENDWEFLDATPLPPLAPGGQALVDALSHCAHRWAEATA